jgi:putative Mn2+ efflux pump MntP
MKMRQKKQEMQIWKLLVLGIVIGSNNLAVSLALGALNQAARRLRIMFVFGVFEFFVPLLGILVGAKLARTIGLPASGAGALLLVGLGLFVIIGGIRKNEDHERLAKQVTTWAGLVLLSMGLSLDNLLVGFGLGLGNADPLRVALTIMCFSVLFTWAGIHLGCVSRRNYERAAKIGAGVLLMGLGVAELADWL